MPVHTLPLQWYFKAEVPEVQNLLENVDGYIRHAILGYGLMTVMDQNDLGHGPMIECQIINLCNIDDGFMDFKAGLLRVP